MNQSMNTPQNQYKIIRELGYNRTGGQLVYLAMNTTTNQAVVIKQFQFTKSNSNDSGLKLYELEAEILKHLNHPGIPRYLNSFENSKGFYLVQEYKDALSLTVAKNYTLEKIQEIAISILDILIYLQSQNPPIIHRDIKPENILIDDNSNIYLVDFGLAQFSGNPTNTKAGGSFGFMPPEQIYNRQLTNATDLYGLGATLICLITGTKSTEIGKLIEEEGQFNFKDLGIGINPNLIAWLGKMVQPNPKDRYPSASAAKVALLQPQPIIIKTNPSLKNQPSVIKPKIKKSILDFFKSLILPDQEVELSNLTKEQITLALTRRGNPVWKETDFEKLLYTLGCAGYGYLKPEAVREQLLAMRQKKVSQKYSGKTNNKNKQ